MENLPANREEMLGAGLLPLLPPQREIPLVRPTPIGTAMHYHCEIIMPNSEDYVRRVEEVMKPFSENEDNEDRRGSGFWDWYQIGGRWSGVKRQAHLDDARVQEFHAELNRRKVTVSGFVWGKQELSPADQIPMVDALWREWFPESGLEACPLFKHAGETLADDVCEFARVSLDLKCERVIVAGPHWQDKDKLEPAFMVQAQFWNGVNHCDTIWDGTLRQAVEQFNENLKRYRKEWADEHRIQPDWLVVTIDYHS